MKIEHIEISNYGPFYGQHHFKFTDRGLTLVMGDNQDEPKMNSNGSGKSSIFNSLDWGLWGKVPSGDHVDSIKNEEAKQCQVTVDLTDDNGRKLQILRKRGKKTELEFMVDGQNLTALDSKETQATIESHLGLDRDVFHAAVLFGQTDLAHYADSTDAERMEVLTKILQLDEIDELLEKTKGDLIVEQGKQTQLVTDFNAKQSFLQSVQAQDFSGQIVQWENTRQSEVGRLNELIAQNTQALSNREIVDGDLANWKQLLVDREAELAGMVVPTDANLGEAQKKSYELTAEMGVLDKEHQKKGRELNELAKAAASPVPVCVECGQEVNNAHIEDKLQAIKNEIGVIRGKLSEMNKQFSMWVAQVEDLKTELDKKIAQYDIDKADKIANATKLRQSIINVQIEKDAIAREQQNLQNLQSMLTDKQGEVNPYVAQEQQQQKQIAELNQALIGIATEKNVVDESIEYLEFWKTAFGPKGLKSYILDSRLQELTDAANQWVKILTGGTIWVQFEAQKQTRGKKTINSPDVRVCRWNPDNTITERNYKSWSGGEKQRISFAIDFGLSRLIASRAKQSYDLLILDEVFKHLDQAGKEAVMEMLQTLALEKNSLFVVEHDTDFQSSFENRILIQKKNRRSIILEDTNGQEQREEATEIKTQVQDIPVGNAGSNRPIRTPVRSTA